MHSPIVPLFIQNLLRYSGGKSKKQTEDKFIFQ